MGVPFHIFLKFMEQKTITYEEFFTPGFFKFAFFPHSFLIVIKFMELWNNGYFNRLLIYPGRKSSLGSSPGSSARPCILRFSFLILRNKKIIVNRKLMVIEKGIISIIGDQRG